MAKTRWLNQDEQATWRAFLAANRLLFDRLVVTLRWPVTTLKPLSCHSCQTARKENRTVAPIGREDRDERQLQQVAEVVRCQPFAQLIFTGR